MFDWENLRHFLAVAREGDGHDRRPCRVAWRKQKRIGVVFA